MKVLAVYGLGCKAGLRMFEACCSAELVSPLQSNRFLPHDVRFSAINPGIC